MSKPWLRPALHWPKPCESAPFAMRLDTGLLDISLIKDTALPHKSLLFSIIMREKS